MKIFAIFTFRESYSSYLVCFTQQSVTYSKVLRTISLVSLLVKLSLSPTVESVNACQFMLLFLFFLVDYAVYKLVRRHDFFFHELDVVIHTGDMNDVDRV